ncbi:MAG: type IV pilus assembly protein PilM [Deltaproteobacteria bacterium]|nr:type IV pilus assembly protein PilM [Deltaproteobacteria bacterium]
MEFSLFKKKETVALDIGSHSIKLVQLSQSKKGWHLSRLAMKELPPEAIVDGSLIDSMTVHSALKEILKENSIKAKDTAISLTGHSVIIKKVSMPAMTEEELGESIQWEAEQYIPFPIADVNIDFQILGEDASGRGQMDVMLVAAKKEVINDYTNLIKEAGLNPVVVDVDAFAIENMLDINYPISANEKIALINIGASITTISVTVGGLTQFTRSIPIGGNRYTEELQRKFNVNFKDAEGLKMGEVAAGIDSQDLAKAITTVSTNLIMEIRRSLDFFLAGGPDMFISKILLSGGGAKIKGLGALIQEKTSINVETANPFNNIEYNHKQFDEEYIKAVAPFFAVAVGLATRRFGDK